MPTRPSTRWLLALFLFALLAAVFALGCQQDEPEAVAQSGPARVLAIPESAEPRPVVSLRVEDLGEIQLELLPDIAPKTVDNFLKLVEEGFYTGTTFHRVIPEFAVQAGDPFTKDRDPRNDGTGGPGYVIEDEFSGYSHVRGIVSMANRGYPQSAGSQFFIVVGDSPPLDGKYTIFGRVVSGMEIVDSVSQVARDVYGRWGPPDRPREDVVIEAASLTSDLAESPVASDLAQRDPYEAGDAALAGEASSR